MIGRDSLVRKGFRLRAADRVEKWSPAGRSDGGKSSALTVPLTGARQLARRPFQRGQPFSRRDRRSATF